MQTTKEISGKTSKAAHYNAIRFLQPAKQTLLFPAAILERL